MPNAARLYKINPDNALEHTNQKFIRRFNYVEAHSIKEGRNLHERVNNWGGFINRKVFFVHFTKDFELIKLDFE